MPTPPGSLGRHHTSASRLASTGGFLAEGDRDLPAVGVADNGPREQVTRSSGDLLKQLNHLRGVGGHPESFLGDERLCDKGKEVRLRPRRFVRVERGAPERGLGAKGLGHC